VLLPIEGLVDLDALRGLLPKTNVAGNALMEVAAEASANLAAAQAQALADLARLHTSADPTQDPGIGSSSCGDRWFAAADHPSAESVAPGGSETRGEDSGRM